MGICKIATAQNALNCKSKLTEFITFPNRRPQSTVIDEVNAKAGVHGIVYLLKNPRDPLLHVFLFESPCLEQVSDISIAVHKNQANALNLKIFSESSSRARINIISKFYIRTRAQVGAFPNAIEETARILFKGNRQNVQLITIDFPFRSIFVSLAKSICFRQHITAFEFPTEDTHKLTKW